MSAGVPLTKETGQPYWRALAQTKASQAPTYFISNPKFVLHQPFISTSLSVAHTRTLFPSLHKPVSSLTNSRQGLFQGWDKGYAIRTTSWKSNRPASTVAN